VKLKLLLLVGIVLGHITGCAGSRALPSSGPTGSSVVKLSSVEGLPGLVVVQVTPELTKKLASSDATKRFSGTWGRSAKPGNFLGAGDVLEISVWEAPPAMLFGASGVDPRVAGSMSTSRNVVFPEQVINAEGDITVPFVGPVAAAGRTLEQLQTWIAKRLKDKANQPQVLVRVLRNNSSVVTLAGEFNQAQRVALTSKGERLLDALASAGGVRQPVGKISLQVTRGSEVITQPLERVIADPAENIFLQPGDVITALYQPFSLTVLGASSGNREVDFEAQGITLAQALARVGGLQDYRADPKGVFVFRVENGLPTVYQMDLRNPAAFFSAREFPMRTKDVLYIANAPATELQKFLGILGAVVAPASTLRQL